MSSNQILLRLLQRAARDKKNMWMGLIYTLLVTLTSLIFPFLLMILINVVLLGKHHSNLGIIVFLMLFNEATSIAVNALSAYHFTILAQNIILQLRLEVTRKLQRVPLEKAEITTAGELGNIVVNNSQVISEVLTSAVPGYLMSVLSMITAIPIILYLNFKISLFLLICLPILWFVGIPFYPWLRRTADVLQRSYGTALQKINESVAGTLEIRKFSQYAWEQIRATKIFTQIHSATKKHFFPTMWSTSTRNLSFYVPLAVVYLWGGSEVISGKWTVGALVAFIQYFSNVTGPLGALTGLSTDLQTISAVTQPMFDFLDEPEVAPDFTSGSGNVTCPFLVRVDGVSYRYPGQQDTVFASLSFSIPASAVTAIVGKNGSGKSTLAELIAGLRTPASGQLIYGEVSPAQIGLLAYSPYIFDGTVKENIIFDRGIDDGRLREVCQLVGLHDHILMMANAYETRIGPGQSDLSAGQLQRLGLARVLLFPPKALILDEALSHIDLESQSHLFRVVKHAISTVIVISHDQNFTDYADHVIRLEAHLAGKDRSLSSCNEVAVTKPSNESYEGK